MSSQRPSSLLLRAQITIRKVTDFAHRLPANLAYRMDDGGRPSREAPSKKAASGRALRPDHPVRDGEAGKARHGVDVELAHDVLAMGLHRAHAHAEPPGNVLVPEALGHAREHLPFAVG